MPAQLHQPIDFFSRSLLIRSPIRFSAMNASAVSGSTWVFWISSLFTIANSPMERS